jgi:hypothetical protein
MKLGIRFLAAVLVLAVLSSQLPAKNPSKVKGKLKVLIADDFQNKKHQKLFFLETDEDATPGVPGSKKHLPLDFDGKPPAGLMTGQALEVSGERKGSQMRVQKLEQIFEPPALMATPSGTPSYDGPIATYTTTPTCANTVLTILLNFTDKPISCSVGQVDSVVFSSAGSTSAVYQENTFNGFALEGTVIGPFTLPYSSTICDPYGYANQADLLAQGAGFNPGIYDHVMYVLPSSACAYGGLGELGASRTWLFYCDWTQVYTHELGHNLGLHHASSIGGEYSDDSDTMGYNLRQFNAPHKADLATRICFNDGGPTVRLVNQCETVNLQALESPSNQDQILKIAKPDTNSFYWISYRVPTGVDSDLSSTYAYKTNIHEWVGSGYVQTQFLDGLDDGESFVDSVNGITITQLSHDNNQAVVSVSIGVCPTFTSTPTPTATPTATPTSSPTATMTFTPWPTLTASPTASHTPTPTPYYSSTPTPTISPSFTVSPTVTLTPPTGCNELNDHDPWRVKVPGNIVRGNRDHVQILMKPCKGGPSNLWVYDASGNLMWEWQGHTGIGAQENGTVVVTMPLEDPSGNALPSGAYTVVYQDASGDRWYTTIVNVR